MPRWVFRYVGNKTFDFSSKKKDFLPKNDQIWPKIGIFGQFGPGHAGLFSALLVGRLVVVARGLYLARHLFTLFYIFLFIYFCFCCYFLFILFIFRRKPSTVVTWRGKEQDCIFFVYFCLILYFCVFLNIFVFYFQLCIFFLFETSTTIKYNYRIPRTSIYPEMILTVYIMVIRGTKTTFSLRGELTQEIPRYGWE